MSSNKKLVATWIGVIALGGLVFGADLHDTIMNRYEKVELAHLPTPLEEMKSLAAELGGPRLYVKRDDQTGLATGGNKTRKLEFIFADVLAKKADVVITNAGIHSNWARQTAAAARHFGVRPILVLSKTPSQPHEVTGNLLLDKLLGAEVRLIEPDEDGWAMVERLAEEERRKGHVPYRVMVGGSMTAGDMTEPLGAIAYANAFYELHRQAQAAGFKVTHVVVATGGGGTQAGLVVGAKAVAPEVEVVGITVSRDKGASQRRVGEIAQQTASALGLAITITPEEMIVFDDYLGEGYGVLTQEVADAIHLVAKKEGLLLDPVYTGKAMAGLLDLVKKGYFEKDDGVVFLHTGGTPGLFVYEDQLLERLGQK